MYENPSIEWTHKIPVLMALWQTQSCSDDRFLIIDQFHTAKNKHGKYLNYKTEIPPLPFLINRSTSLTDYLLNIFYKYCLHILNNKCHNITNVLICCYINFLENAYIYRHSPLYLKPKISISKVANRLSTLFGNHKVWYPSLIKTSAMRHMGHNFFLFPFCKMFLKLFYTCFTLS